MLRIFIGLSCFFISLFTLSYSDDVVGKVASLNGQAWVLGESNIKTSASLGMNIRNSDVLMTGKKSFMQVVFIDGTKINMVGDSELYVKSIVFDESLSLAKIDLESKKGLYQFVSGKISEIAPSNFRLKTDTATIGIQGSSGLIKDLGERGSSFTGTNVTYFPDSKANQLANLLRTAKSLDAEGRDLLKKIAAILNTPDGLATIVDSKGMLQVVFSDQNKSRQSHFIKILPDDTSEFETMAGSPDQIFRSYTKVLTGNSSKNKINASDLEKFNKMLDPSSKSVRQMAQKIEICLHKKEGSKQLFIKVIKLANSLNDASADIGLLKVDLERGVIKALPQSSLRDERLDFLENKKDEIEFIRHEVSKAIQDFSLAESEPQQSIQIDRLESIYKNEKKVEMHEEQELSKSEAQEVKATLRAEKHVIDSLGISKDQDAQTQIANSVSPLNTNRELLDQALADGRADFRGRASLETSGRVEYGDIYYFSNPDMGKKALSQNGFSSAESRMLLLSGEGTTSNSPDLTLGEIFSYSWYVSDINESIFGFAVNEPEFRNSSGRIAISDNGGASNGSLYHLIASLGADSNITALGSTSPMTSLPNITSGRERFYSKPSDEVGEFSGTTGQGFSPTIDFSKSYSIAEIDYDNSQIMLCVMGDNRESYIAQD